MTAKRALVVVDMQSGSFGEKEPVAGGEQLLSVVTQLVTRARSADTPIAFIQHCGGPGDPDEPGTSGFPIHPEVEPQVRDIVFQKETPDSFHKTGLHEHLQSIGATDVIVCGIQTEYCIDTTTRRAYSLGYAVTLGGDGHSTWDGTLSAVQKIAHHNEVLGGWFANVINADQVCFE